MADSTARNSAPVKVLRLWSGVGSAVLIAGLAILVTGVVIWQPLNTAPLLWVTGTGTILAIGLVITVIATSMLASKSRQR